MPLFPWKAEYSVGVDQLDREHRALVDILNSLHDEMKSGRGAQQLAHTLFRLADYTEKHFQNEETLMRGAGYPDLDEHCRVHRAMSEKVRRLREQVLAGDARITTEVLNFLKGWLSEHILKTDRKYANHLQAAAVR